LIAAGPTQYVRRLDAHRAMVVVRAIRPSTDLNTNAFDDMAFPAESEPGGPAYLRANDVLQSDAPEVVALAREAAPGETDPAALAFALEKHVHGAMREVDFSQAFASAREVARSRKGDCSEFAVLLAAMLRARGVPSRVAFGLVYVERSAAMGYHMWTEAWIGDRWLPLDATLGKGGIAADHIKLGASGLDRGLADPALLRVADLLGAKPSIEFIETEENAGAR
jgi:transglutaminase-like putative cysteine protease